MQDATTVLSIIRNRGERGLPLKRLYRQLYNPQFYFQAYARLYSNELDFIHSLDKKGKAEYSSLKLFEKKDEGRWICQKRLYKC